MSMEQFIGQLEEINEIITMCKGRYSDSVEIDFVNWLIKRKENIKDNIAIELDYIENYYVGE